MKNFGKILIVNRGEIAVRIIKTLDKLGIPSVVVYTKNEHDSLAVKMAGEAYLLAGDTINETFLNIQQIIEIAILLLSHQIMKTRFIPTGYKNVAMLSIHLFLQNVN